MSLSKLRPLLWVSIAVFTIWGMFVIRPGLYRQYEDLKAAWYNRESYPWYPTREQWKALSNEQRWANVELLHAEQSRRIHQAYAYQMVADLCHPSNTIFVLGILWLVLSLEESYGSLDSNEIVEFIEKIITRIARCHQGCLRR